MPDENPSSDAPQFGKAEYAPQQKAGACALCGRELSAAYYRVKNAIACEACAFEAKSSGRTDTHSAFLKAVMLGIGAAIIGMICYAAFTIMTGVEIGFVSLGVGFLVGKAMKLGSGGLGGRRYQIAAAILTYAAVSLAAIPMAILPYGRSSAPANIGSLVYLGLASPFLQLQADLIHGAIGLLILFIGIQFAWKLTAGSETPSVTGPFVKRAAAPGPPPSL
jgi:uncharacterized protein (DUF983 family)